MNKTIIRVIALLSMTNLSYASPVNPWTVDATFGLTSYSDIANNEGQTGIARLSLGHALITKPSWQVSLEAGIQSGATLHLDLPKESIEELGGVPIDGEMKPLLDILAGVKTKPWRGRPIITWLKGGVAYRQLQANHLEVNHLSGFCPEIQAGLGYQINEETTVNLVYQHIWGRKPELTANPETQTGELRNMPAQQALMIGFSFHFR